MHRIEDLPVLGTSLKEIVDELMARSTLGESHPLLPNRPFEPLLQELNRCMVTADQIQEIQAIADGVRHIRVVVCRQIGPDTGGEFYDLQQIPSLKGGYSSIAAISYEGIKNCGGRKSVLDVLIHELAHEFGATHDVWFAALVNWQRMKCGLAPSPFPYDVSDERRFVSFGGIEGEAGALALSAALATLLHRSELGRSGVFNILRIVKEEAKQDIYEDSIALGIRVAALIAA